MPATKRAPSRPVTSSEPIPVDQGVETWRNVTPGVIVINRVGEYGRPSSDLIQGGRTFQVTPQERRMNQNAVALVSQDPFTNGCLQPEQLIDGEPDTEFLLQNPNMFDEKDLPKLFKLKGDAFTDRVAQITNAAAITRIVEIARDPRYDATLAQYEIVKNRKLELDGDLDQTPPADAPGGVEGLPRGVTPR